MGRDADGRRSDDLSIGARTGCVTDRMSFRGRSPECEVIAHRRRYVRENGVHPSLRRETVA